MGFRVNLDEEASRRDFDRVSLRPGGRLAYLARFPEAIEWIENPTLIEQLVVLKKVTRRGWSTDWTTNPYTIKSIGVLHPELVSRLVKSSVADIPNLEQYPEKVQRDAVQRRPSRIKSLTNPSEATMMICASHHQADLSMLAKFKPNDRILLRAIKTRGEAIGYIEKPTLPMMELAVRKNSDHLDLIEDPPESIIRLAISRSGMAIQYVKNPSDELQHLAVSKCAQAITVINNPLPELQVQAVTKSPNMIRLIKDPCEEAMWVALGKKPKLIKDMKYATPEMHGYAKMVQ
jgi:hypothetical protein